MGVIQKANIVSVLSVFFSERLWKKLGKCHNPTETLSTEKQKHQILLQIWNTFAETATKGN